MSGGRDRITARLVHDGEASQRLSIVCMKATGSRHPSRSIIQSGLGGRPI